MKGCGTSRRRNAGGIPRGVEDFLQAFATYFEQHADAGADPLRARKRAIALLSDLVGTVALERGTARANPRLSLGDSRSRARTPAGLNSQCVDDAGCSRSQEGSRLIGQKSIFGGLVKISASFFKSPLCSLQ